MFNQIVLWSLLLVPWLLLIPLRCSAVRRFLPSALFGALLLTIIFQMAEKYEWWIIEDNIPILSNITPFVYGLFLVGTVIILHFTYGRFFLYILTNLIVDAGLSFGLDLWFQHLGIYRLERISNFGVYLLTCIVSVLIYLYQKWQDPIMASD